MLGVNISTSPEITSIENDGFWLLVEGKEYFVDFSRYPDFCSATVSQIFNFEYDLGELHWSELDIDIEIEALDNPEGYPLIFQR